MDSISYFRIGIWGEYKQHVGLSFGPERKTLGIRFQKKSATYGFPAYTGFIPYMR